MKREGTIGAAAFLAIAAALGFSLESGPRPVDGGKADRTGAVTRPKPTLTKNGSDRGAGCDNLKEELQDFLEIGQLPLPDPCYEKGKAPPATQLCLADKTSRLKFVVAILPDPVHTHLSALFDQFAVAIQEAAQDERYDFDASWLPWELEETRYALFSDEKASNWERGLKEDQPGIILFRKTPDCDEKQPSKCRETWPSSAKDETPLSKSYRDGLVVFVVGEDATHGIHRAQFRNALAWIAMLQPFTDRNGKRLAILGPTFSGSLPSMTQILSETQITDQLDLLHTRNNQQLAVYSGSVSSSQSAQIFQNTFASKVVFHSFVESDDEILRRFCNYITKEQKGFDPGRIAIISEDETAYGRMMKTGSSNNDCSNHALKLYYPRDISALRGAYQTKSLFGADTSSASADAQRRNLPSDLADPAGNVHDSIRSYGGNQTPLAQEAFLMEIVAALRELHARYVLLRSSNTLDQLFLTNFLRRAYPDGRIVILGSDLMFIRERGATGLSGSMTLSTYPLFPLERDWSEHQSLPASDRVFGADTTEGTYVAFRLLLNDRSLHNGEPQLARCHVFENTRNQEAIFLPRVSCATDPPIPDYSPPFWTLADECGEMEKASTGEECPYRGPATWLSVIGVNRFWPMAALTQNTPLELPVDSRIQRRANQRENEPGGRPEMPLGMKMFLLVLAAFSLFHAWCCWSGSYTAKPAFRAHFASIGDWRHTLLVFMGSCYVAFLAIVAGWGSGVFSTPAAGLVYPWFALDCVTFVWLMAWVALLANNFATFALSKDLSVCPDLPRMTRQAFTTWNYRGSGLLLIAILLFCRFFVVPIENVLLTENRVLTYWRAMHLGSGVSPIVPVIFILVGLYLSFWFTLHGLALFGPDRPCLPSKGQLVIQDAHGNKKNFLRMFSQEDAEAGIEKAAQRFDGKMAAIGSGLFVLFLAVAWGIAGGVPVRSLGARTYAIIFLLWLDACCCLSIVEACRLYQIWEDLRRLLTFLDRLPLRRAMAALHGFSWGSVWKMSGNVLEVRYKVISRQMECMNHTVASLEEFLRNSSDPADICGARDALAALTDMREAGIKFADWYSRSYDNPFVGDLTRFRDFQRSIASASGTLCTQLLLPAWRKEEDSLLVGTATKDGSEDAPNPPPPAKELHIRNAEEFVCLNYLGFIQNVLGRLRTIAMSIMVLFLASTTATSTYPFDPRQALSAVLIALLVVLGAVIVKVYAEMHRDATLSHVTNTKPGELGSEFWLKLIGFGFAPVAGLLARVFPGVTDFVFAWLQPGISSLK
jgi:hypothetical protein